MKTLKTKVFAAMSGGVDSSVAAALLKRDGFDVRGVFVKIWSSSLPCDQKQDRLDALRVALQLKIPFETWDFSRQYKKDVVDYMVSGYGKGFTPNPDIMCNKYIKFGLFLERALKEGADYIATGHYLRRLADRSSRLSTRSSGKPQSAFSPRRLAYGETEPVGTGRAARELPAVAWSLFQAKDKNKDQSYFLWTLTQKQLKHCLFPIGRYTKPEVRELAKKFGLHTAQKRDSQGICFLGKINLANFLKKRLRPKPGPIFTVWGEKIGEHQGLFLYTIGQRKGIGLSDGPWFVAGKDLKNNILIVTKNKKDLLKKEIICKKVNWISGNEPKLPLKVGVKVRYRTPSASAVISKTRDKQYKIRFFRPQRAIAPGQSVVFYKKAQMLGGGVIL